MTENTATTNLHATVLLDKNREYFDTIALLFFTLLFLIDFIPTFEIVGYTPPIHYLYLSLLNVSMGIFIFCNPVLFNTSFFGKIKKSLVSKIYFLFIILCFVSILFARNIPLSIVNCNYLLIIFTTVVNFGILFNNRLYLIYKATLIVILFCFSEVLIALLDFIKLYRIDPSTAYNISLNTGNINIFAASLNLKIPFLLFGMCSFSGWKKWISITAFTISCLLIFLNTNKAAFLSLSLITIIFLFYNSWRTKAYKKIAFVVLPIIATYLLSNIINDIPKTEIVAPSTTEISNVLPESESIISTLDNESSLSSRLSFWENSFELAQKNLFTGVGIGNYPIEITPYDNKSLSNGILTLHPHNDFVEITVETGIINGLIYVSLFIIILIVNLKRIKSDNEQTRIIALITLLMLVVYSVDSFLNFPLYQPTIQISLCLILVFTLLNTSSKSNEKINFISNKYLLPIIFVSIFSVYGSYIIVKTYMIDLEIKTDMALEKHVLTSDYLEKNLPNYPNVNSETYPFLQKLGVYYYLESNYDASKKMFKKSKLINPFSGVEEWYLSKIYQKTNIDSSQYYIKKSFELRPRDLGTYLDVLYVSNIKKDTATIYETNSIYSSYNDLPINYIYTSNALYNSGYSIKNLNKFIDEGLLKFPNDSLLMDRKKMFQKVLDASKGKITNNPEIGTSTKVATEDEANAKTKKLISINIVLQEAINYAAKAQYDLAVKNYLKVLEQYPDNLAIYQNIGICKFEQKKFSEAIPYLEKSLKDSSLYDGKSQYLLGICYLNTQQKDKGCEYLTIAKNKNYPNASQISNQYCK